MESTNTTHRFMYRFVEGFIFTKDEQNYKRHINMMRITIWSVVQCFQNWNNLEIK